MTWGGCEFWVVDEREGVRIMLCYFGRQGMRWGPQCVDLGEGVRGMDGVGSLGTVLFCVQGPGVLIWVWDERGV